MSVSASVVAVGSTATLVATASPNPTRIRLRNGHATNSAFLGASGVTTTTGYELPFGSAFDVLLSPGDKLYAIAAVASTLHVLQLSN